MTKGSIDLNGTWQLATTDDFPDFLKATTLPGRWQLSATVPASVQSVLMEHGLIDDPRVGLNSLKARWVEEQYWRYSRTFPTPEAVSETTPTYLTFQCLEMNAVVYLNGAEAGRHVNAHRPARFDVTGKLNPDGENVLVVLLEAGLFDVADKPGAEYRDSPQALLTKIHWQRRGQWQRGWDWQQRLLNVGILGDVRLEWSDTSIVKQCMVFATVNDDLTEATFTARLAIENPLSESVEAYLFIGIDDEPSDLRSQTREFRIILPPGESVREISHVLPNPELWWPIGHGKQEQYKVHVALYQEELFVCTRQVGVRKVEIDQSPHPVEGKHFILKINNRPIFCKGGNWIPADMLHSTVTTERYRELVDLAVEANFNLLRIWGGGIFADHAFLSYCDAKGILVWHDLLFACSKYPGDDPEFAAEVEKEVTYAVRDLAHHASLVVWCGNNEIEEGDWHWGWQKRKRVAPHYALFHRDLPRIVQEEDPSKFYWISSPFSPDLKSPRDPTVGDQHPWGVWIGQGEPDWWTYRTYVDRFPNEGGVMGASTPATLRQFLPEKEQYLLSPSWEHHDNPFAINGAKPGDLGRSYAMVKLWTGLDPLTLDLDRYAYVSGLLHAEGFSEYIANYRRRMFSSASAIFWMYNDSWPATHSWSIVDYYRRKKLAYHPVRRAFAPVSIVVAETRTEAPRIATIFGVNDSPEDWIGYWDGGQFLTNKNIPKDGRKAITLPANSVTNLGDYGLLADSYLDRTGWFGVLYDESGKAIAQHRVFFRRFHELQLVRDPEIDMRLENGVLTLTSDVFCWGVCLDADGDKPVADNCFDLLPGIPYTLPYDETVLGEPRILRLGNRDALPDIGVPGL